MELDNFPMLQLVVKTCFPLMQVKKNSLVSEVELLEEEVELKRAGLVPLNKQMMEKKNELKDFEKKVATRSSEFITYETKMADMRSHLETIDTKVKTRKTELKNYERRVAETTRTLKSVKNQLVFPPRSPVRWRWWSPAKARGKERDLCFLLTVTACRFTNAI